LTMPMPVIPDVDLLPANPPNTNDPQNFDPRADAFVAALVLMVVQLNAFIEAMGLAGVFIEQRAADANNYAGQADGRATAAGQALAGALEARDACLAYAQAMGGASGIPDPIAFGVVAADGNGAVAFRDLATLPAMLAKLARVGGVATALGQPNKLHVIAAGVTAVLNITEASVHRLEPAGAAAISFAGWAGNDVSQELELHCVNFGGKSISWPPGIWVKADKSRTTDASAAGINWPASGQIDLLVCRDFGQIIYKVA